MMALFLWILLAGEIILKTFAGKLHFQLKWIFATIYFTLQFLSGNISAAYVARKRKLSSNNRNGRMLHKFKLLLWLCFYDFELTW